MKKYKILLALFLFSFLMVNSSAFSQIPTIGGNPEKSDKNLSFMPIPCVNYDRTLGFSEGFVPMAMYNLNQKDTISPSSISGGFGMYTSNKSWFIMQFNKFYFKEDKYRAVLAGGIGDFNS